MNLNRYCQNQCLRRHDSSRTLVFPSTKAKFENHRYRPPRLCNSGPIPLLLSRRLRRPRTMDTTTRTIRPSYISRLWNARKMVARCRRSDPLLLHPILAHPASSPIVKSPPVDRRFELRDISNPRYPYANRDGMARLRPQRRLRSNHERPRSHRTRSGTSSPTTHLRHSGLEIGDIRHHLIDRRYYVEQQSRTHLRRRDRQGREALPDMGKKCQRFQKSIVT